MSRGRFGGLSSVSGARKTAEYFGVRAGDTSDAQETAWETMLAAAADEGIAGIDFGAGTYYKSGPATDIRDGQTAGSFVGSAAGFRAGFTLGGRGSRGTRIQLVDSGQGVARFYAASPATQWWDINIEGIQFLGPDITNPNTFCLQFNGVEAGTQHITSGLHFHDTRFANFYTHVRAEDITSWLATRTFMEGMRYGIEANYNIDIVAFLSGEIGDQAQPSGVSVTFSTSTPRTATLSAANAAKVRAGMVISSSSVPAGTRVTAVDPAGAITFDQDATANGATVCDFSLGIFASYGNGPWVPAANSINTSRGDSNAHVFQSMWFMRLERLFEVFKGSSSNIRLCDGYIEKCSQIATLGDPANNTQGPQQFILDNMFLSQPNYRSAAVEVLNANGADVNVTIRNTRRSDPSSLPAWGAVPFFKSAGLTGIKLDWDNNQLYTTDAAVPQIQLGSRNITLGTNSSRSSYSVGLRKQPGYTETVAYAATIGLSCTEGNTDRFDITLTGNTTLAAPSTTNLYKGFRIWIYFTQDATGGRTVTWNAAFKGATLTGSGTAGQKAIVGMEYDGANFVQFMSTGWY